MEIKGLDENLGFDKNESLTTKMVIEWDANCIFEFLRLWVTIFSEYFRKTGSWARGEF